MKKRKSGLISVQLNINEIFNQMWEVVILELQHAANAVETVRTKHNIHLS